uniref:Phosphoglycerate mutase (2,3-diphosphoglycerate-dependent) n=1 Tax=Salix viminalis TaxID=40686 RepID=A0A6N2KXA3_SALVM
MANSNDPGHSGTVGPTCAEIIVVRHGETVWNVDGRIQGHIDVELNDVGENRQL